MRSLIILVSTLALAGCNMAAEAQSGDIAPASGEGNRRSYQVGSFNAVALGGHHNVIVTVGPAPSVRAEGDPDELDRLEIRIKEGRLHIGQKKERNWSFGSRPPVTVHVTVPTLAKASVGGSGEIRIDKVEGDSFEASIGGSGEIDVAALQVRNAAFSVGGSGTVRAVGRADAADVSIAGSGEVDTAGLEARNAQIKVAGSGDARLRALETAQVSIAGSGDVTVSGPAKCTLKKAGSGDLHCGG